MNAQIIHPYTEGKHTQEYQSTNKILPIIATTIAFVSTIVMIFMGLYMYLKINWIGEKGTDSFPLYNAMYYYQKTTLVPNYFELGFIRRGLAGTIARLLSSDFQSAGIRLHVASLICTALAWGTLMLQLGKRLRLAGLIYVAAAVALSPQTFRGWALDIARSDMLVIGIVSWAVIATLKGYRFVAILLVQCAQLVHELGAVFGYPLLVVLNMQSMQAGLLPRRDIWRMLGLAMIGSASIIALQTIYGQNPANIASYIFRNVPPASSQSLNIDRDIATYYLVSGLRGISAAICFNLQLNRQYFIGVTAGTMIIFAYMFIFGLHRRLLAVCFASVFPFLFMCLIATDTGRWIKMGVANTWLLAAGLTILGPAGMILERRVMIVGCGIMALFFALGPTTILDASYGIRTALARLGVPYPEPFDKALDDCDPSWRSLLPPHQ